MSSTSLQTIGAIKAYHHQAQHLVNNYLLADPFIPYTSVLTGIFLSKVVKKSLINDFKGTKLDFDPNRLINDHFCRSMIFVTS